MISKVILTFTALLIAFSTMGQDGKIYTLEQCRSMAMENNKKMRAAHFQLEAARAAKKSADVNAYPLFDASVMGFQLGKPIGGALNGAIPELMASGTLNASLPVYAGGKIQNGKAAAGKVVEATEEQKNVTEADVLLQTEEGYWRIVQVREKIVLATRFKTMLEALRKDLENSFNAGLSYKNDLLQVQVNLNEANLNLEKAHDGLVLAKLNLAQIIGDPGNINFDVTESISDNFLLPGKRAENATQNRPEIKALTKALEAEQLQQKILQGDRLPTVALAASGLASAGKSVNIKDGSNFMASYYSLASISIPVFDWGKKAGKVREQSYKIAAQQARLDETKELINIEVQGAYLQLKQSANQISYSELSLKQATENLKLAQDRLAAGTIVGKDVLEAQAIWQQAYSKLIDARIEYKVNKAVYEKSIGELAP